MLKKRAVTWLLVSLVSAWLGLAAAEPQELQANTASPLTAGPRSPQETVVVEGEEEALAGDGVVVVVESVGKGSALERAGLQQGDIVLSWERLPNPPANPQGAQGKIQSYGDWVALKEEQSPRGSFRLRIQRGPVYEVLEVPLASWSVRARPLLTASEESCLKVLASQIGAGGTPADSCWSTVFPAGIPLKRESAFFWLAASLARSLGRAKRVQEAQEFLESVMPHISRTELQVPALWLLATLHSEVGEFEEARQMHFRAAKAVESTQGRNLLWARCKTAAFAVSLLDRTEVGLQKELLDVLALREALAPGSADVASSFNNLAVVASSAGDFEKAARYFKEALDIFVNLEPTGNEVATTLSNYSGALWKAGDLEDAEASARRSLALREQLETGAEEIVASLINIGVILEERGFLDEAEVFYSRALSRVEADPRLAQSKLMLLNNLGALYWKRGAVDRANFFISQALEMLDTSGENDGRKIALMENLGVIEKELGKYKEAQSLLLKARQLAERLSPSSSEHWSVLSSLAHLDLSLGRVLPSIHWSLRALAMARDFAPGSLYEARSLTRLGESYLLQERYDSAEEALNNALSIIHGYLGQPIERARTLSLVARLKLKRGEPRGAADLFEKVAQSTEHASDLSGGHFQDVLRYRDVLSPLLDGYVGALVDAGMPGKAFQELERMRARSFAALLRERDLRFKEGEAGKLIEERRILERKYDRLQVQLLRLSESNPPVELDEVLGRLHETDARLSQVASTIKISLPRVAALYDLGVPDLVELRKKIPKGLLVLSFATERERSFVFALSADMDLRYVGLDISKSELFNMIYRFDVLLAEGNKAGHLSAVRRAAAVNVGRELYGVLLGPFDYLIDNHERVLIIADGPLRMLPFSALGVWRHQGLREGKNSIKYVADMKPFHFDYSLVSYVQSNEIPPPKRGTDGWLGRIAFVGFGSPSVARLETPSDFSKSSFLHYSGREVQAIGSLFSDGGTVKVFVGDEATEERAKALGEGPQIIHFATHAYLDDHLPLDSSIALAMSAGPGDHAENGLLQVWEIFEQMRLNARLVVLSGCRTALDQLDGGDGLMGLARAFQYAGARSVLASLWRVQDQATSELMIRFYRHLRAGLPKDQALQAAQQELIRGPIEITNEKGEHEIRDFTAPYYWAGFQLYGDWQ